MIFSLLLCLTVSIHAAMLTEYADQNNRLENKCNQDIPEGQSVELDGECRSSINCQRANLASQCVYKRDNYCRCELIGEERKIKKQKRCKRHEGHSCSRKSKCAKKYRKRRKICKHPRHVCCTKCKSINDNYECVSSKICSGPRKKHYQCEKKSQVCCKKRELIYGESCRRKEECVQDNQHCHPQTKKCSCTSGHYYDVSKGCVPEKVTACEDVPPHTCIDQSECKQGTIQPDHYCEDSSTVCCEKQPACASSYTAFRGHKLKVFSEGKYRADAKKACEADGARLVVIKDADMNSATIEASNEAGIPSNTVMLIGLKFVSKDASFYYYEWDNGDTLKTNLDGSAADGGYTSWYASHSHEATDDDPCFGFVIVGLNAGWEYSSCDLFPLAYICECA